MLTYLTSALAIIGALAVAFLIYVALKPNDFRVARSAEVRAPADAIHPLINNLAQFNRWNPFAEADPDVNIVYSGPPAGVGAAYDWNGKKSGAGRMEIETSTPSRIRMKLDFNKPFVAHNIAEFSLAPHGSTTTVTWAMTGKSPYLHKLMGTLFNMDKMVGGEFAKGLTNLKTIAEKTS